MDWIGFVALGLTFVASAVGAAMKVSGLVAKVREDLTEIKESQAGTAAVVGEIRSTQRRHSQRLQVAEQRIGAAETNVAVLQSKVPT